MTAIVIVALSVSTILFGLVSGSAVMYFLYGDDREAELRKELEAAESKIQEIRDAHYGYRLLLIANGIDTNGVKDAVDEL